ncbi:MAG TPA: hypothetical protein VID51_01710 [Solirubrobacterales bacterium]|jgi:hypothetical protein
MAEVALDSWEDLRSSVNQLQKAISRSSATHINTQSLKEAAKRLVQQYFRVVRPDLEGIGIDESELSGADAEMQALLGLAASRNRKSSYVAVIRNVRTQFDELEPARELRLGQARTETSVRSIVETQILETLRQLVPSAGLSYQQALNDLQDETRVSFRGTANELREALRETLDHLAPDGDVEASGGFKLEKNRTKPTQKQKVRYILRSRGVSGTARQTPEAAASLVDELTASVTRASFERGNLSAHIASTEQEVRQLKMYVDSVLAELLEIHA